MKQILVTGKNFGPVSSLQDLSGKKVFVNPLTTYYDNLQKVSDSLVKQGKPPILIEKADKNLKDEDLMEMVNAGILPATVTITSRAKLWANVFHDITPQLKIVIADEQDLAWAMRKDNPEVQGTGGRVGEDPCCWNVVRQHPDAALPGKREVHHQSDE